MVIWIDCTHLPCSCHFSTDCTTLHRRDLNCTGWSCYCRAPCSSLILAFHLGRRRFILSFYPTSIMFHHRRPIFASFVFFSLFGDDQLFNWFHSKSVCPLFSQNSFPFDCWVQKSRKDVTAMIEQVFLLADAGTEHVNLQHVKREKNIEMRQIFMFTCT